MKNIKKNFYQSLFLMGSKIVNDSCSAFLFVSFLDSLKAIFYVKCKKERLL